MMEQPGTFQHQRPFGESELDPNNRFLFKLFRRYYRSFTPEMPDRFTKKEYGFIPFGKTMQRHIAFANPDELKTYMFSKVPAHSYYSTAYYRHPSMPLMEDKEWMGAELIFDLDADHLAGAEEMTYSEMMVQIRKEMISLVDDFLYSDLGFSEKQVNICFSGGRGYHAHIRTNDIYTLGTNERRELVDYVSCMGLDLDWVFPNHTTAIGANSIGNGLTRSSVKTFRLIPSEESGGWKLKMRECLKLICKNIIEEDPKKIKAIYPSIKTSVQNLENLKNHLRQSETKLFSTNSMMELTAAEQDILMKALKDVAPTLSSEVDKPVTPDIKRLIRLPGSLHGKTGLRVTPITRDQLTDYDPLQYAVPEVYSSDPVKVPMRKDMDLYMLGEHMSLKGETEVPEFAAPLLIGRKYASYGWNSEQKQKLF
ncbi:MAG: DNA primase catalytic subunit PriS [archaeon]|nr:DNA primase catalytic subunit PriS [archaeon]